MSRLFSWLTSMVEWHTFGLMTLLFIVLISMASGISAVVSDLETALLWPIAFYGMLLGWFLARSELAGRWVVVICFGFGLLVVFLQVGQLFGPIGRLIWAGINYLWARLSENLSPDLAPITLAWSDITFRGNDVIYRLNTWIQNLIQGKPNIDFVVSAWIWGVLTWITSTWAGWSIRRLFQPLWAVLPATVILGVVLTYTVGRGVLLVPVVGATLALLGIVAHDERVKDWEQSRIDYAATIREEMIWVILLVSLGAMVMSLLVPSISIQTIFNPVRNFVSERMEEQEDLVRSIGLEPYGEGSRSDSDLASGMRGLPRSHLIGSGPELSQQVVMVVFVTSGFSDTDELHREPLYWRSLTFDEYTGSGWNTGKITSRSYQAGERFAFNQGENYRPITQEVRVTRDQGGLLYSAGRFFSADQDFRAVWRTPTSESETGDYLPDLFGVSVQASSYRVQSFIPLFSKDSLRRSSEDYPSWVADRYLALPEDIPQRVLDLASSLTNSYDTVFDKAARIETYLRSYEYTLDLPAPPEDKDVADYFLFELQKGYCDYYATSMVVLSRAAGIPSRIATGFARGLYDQDNGRYIVTEADAHSWVEVFFPEVGWVPFEPTGGLPAIERPESVFDVPPELEGPLEPLDVTVSRYQWSFGKIIILLCVLVLLVIILWDWLGIWLLRRNTPQVAVAKIYQRLYILGDRLGVPVYPKSTPYEFAGQLINKIQTFVSGSRWEPLFEAIYQDVRSITERYIESQYSPRNLTVGDHIRLIDLWSRLRRRLILTMLGYQIIRIFRGEW
ncbi:MAG: transglutaminase domain-containing protein, partial [Anaerolineales bacterium]